MSIGRVTLTGAPAVKANFKQNGTLIRAWGLALVCGAYSELALFKNYPPFTYLPEIPLAIIIAYLVITAELAARHVEQPFDTRGDHLELEGVCRVIDASVSQNLVDQGDA